VSLLLKSWPGAVEDGDWPGPKPLDFACVNGSSKEAVSLLLSMIEKGGRLLAPLQSACRCKASMEVILLLLEKWLEEKTNRNSFSMNTLAGGAPEDVKNLLSHISSLFNDEVNNPSLHGTLTTFNSIGWKKGISLLINVHPKIIKSLYRMLISTYKSHGWRSLCGWKTLQSDNSVGSNQK